MRVPAGKGMSLFKAKAQGADIRMIYSPMDALELAKANPEREVVFFAIGFETTTPPTAVVLKAAKAAGVKNFSVFCNHVLTPAAMTHILKMSEERPEVPVLDGLVGPAHVSTIIGSGPYEVFARDNRLPVVVTGFEPLDMLYAMLVPSANDAASVLASDAAGGDLAAFAARMNARASQLGCTSTHFTCPHGLYDHNNYSTARDMAKIALACHANGTYMQVANTVSYTLPATNLHPARNISSTNRLLKPGSAYYRGYAQGMKTGFTTQAGRCFVTFASQSGRTYGLVILGSNSQNIFREAAELFDWAFSNPDLQPKAAAPETKKHSLFSFWQNLLG